MKTSNYKISATDPNAIAISVMLPRFGPKPKQKYPALAPTRAMLKMSEADYEKHFDEILAGLDPQTVWDELHALVEGEPIILCYEPFNIRCHRRIVAEYFERHLGVVVPEVGHERSESIPFADQARKEPAKKKGIIYLTPVGQQDRIK